MRSIPQPPRAEPLPLKQGEVVYLGYRSDIAATVYAVRDGRAPYVIGEVIATALGADADGPFFFLVEEP